MDWIQGIQNVIDYIEEHITEDIEYDCLAKTAYSSSYHFQRVFGIMCGITLGEYIRRRRLTLAGNELLTTDTNITELAYKYGYDTPESFSRAFKRFHGLNPSQVKKKRLLNSFDYCIIANVNDDGYDFYAAYELDEWTRKELYNPKTTGVDFMDKMGFETIVIPKSLYAVFETGRKKRPVCDYVDIRKKIITEWLPASDYQLADAPEVIKMHWRPQGEWEKERYIEICLPIEIRQPLIEQGLKEFDERLEKHK